MVQLFTIGFAGKTAERFFGLLQEHHVRQVIDTRRHPASQLSGFAKQQDLRFFLAALCNIGYVYREDFAPSAGLLTDYRTKQIDWEQYADRYRKEISERNVRNTDVHLLNGSCLLCSEHRPDQCHRSLLAGYFQELYPALRIKHIVLPAAQF